MTDDHFGAAGIRDRVLAAWSASPTRFREDANAEEDLVLGGYRDRLVVELAQNAADAAVKAGVPGRLLLSLIEPNPDGGAGVLVAANTGAVLDAAGVQALATLRASAKRDGDTIGRFGVGFAAVLAVSDEPAVLSRSGGVRFSAADTRQLVESAAGTHVGGQQVGGTSELGDELVRRDGHVPVLRLPFATEGTPPDGYDTAVLLPLRHPIAEDLVLRLLTEVDDRLLLALPALAEIVIELPGRPARVLRDVTERWHVLRREGTLSPAALAGRPTEERGRGRWELTWALPHTPADLPEPAVVLAPTPSDEPLPWPAVLIATLPLDPSRRHVAAGPVTDELLAAAAEAYVELLVERAAAGDQVWPLVLTGLPAGALDGELRAAVLALLPVAPILTSAEDPAMVIRPREALALAGPVGADKATVTAFASWLAGLVLAPRAASVVLDALGVRRITLADAVEMLPPVADPLRWHQVYGALAPLAGDAQVREALAFLPVPLADGTVVRGMRSLLLTSPDLTTPDVTAALVLLGVRSVHPDAVHPLLERLGAVVTGPRALLDLPAVRAAVRGLSDGATGGELSADLDAPSDEQVADAVLTLASSAVRSGDLNPGDLPWLGDLVLPDEDGELAPAAALALPDSPAARWFDGEEIGLVGADVLDRWGTATLAAVGVLDGPGVIRAQDVPLEPEFGVDPTAAGALEADLADLDGWDDWCELAGAGPAGRGGPAGSAGSAGPGGLPPGAVLAELVAVRDLDAVRPEALPEVVATIAADPLLRPALVGPARIVAEGRSFDVTPYTAWWLREELGGVAGALAGPDAEPGLGVLFPLAPGWVTRLDPAAQRALGVLSRLADLDPAAIPGLLERLADDSLELPPGLLVQVLSRLAELAGQGLDVDAPQQVRGLDGDGTLVVPAGEAVVIEAPMYRQRADLGLPLPAPPRFASALADLLDLPLAGELAAGKVLEDDGCLVQSTAAEVRRLLPQVPPTWCEHDSLLVDGVEVDWWVDGAGAGALVHAATTDGLARGLAWAAGRWELRAVVAAVLAEPELAAEVMIDQVWA